MRWVWVSRRRAEAEIAVVAADRERIRQERDQFAADRDTFRRAAARAAEQYADAAIREELLTAELATEKRRADQLQQRLDDAVGITAAEAAGRGWQDRRADKRTP